MLNDSKSRNILMNSEPDNRSNSNQLLHFIWSLNLPFFLLLSPNLKIKLNSECLTCNKYRIACISIWNALKSIFWQILSSFTVIHDWTCVLDISPCCVNSFNYIQCKQNFFFAIYTLYFDSMWSYDDCCRQEWQFYTKDMFNSWFFSII